MLREHTNAGDAQLEDSKEWLETYRKNGHVTIPTVFSRDLPRQRVMVKEL
jgi:nitrate reductase alpha subunit